MTTRVLDVRAGSAARRAGPRPTLRRRAVDERAARRCRRCRCTTGPRRGRSTGRRPCGSCCSTTASRARHGLPRRGARPGSPGCPDADEVLPACAAARVRSWPRSTSTTSTPTRSTRLVDDLQLALGAVHDQIVATYFLPGRRRARRLLTTAWPTDAHVARLPDPTRVRFDELVDERGRPAEPWRRLVQVFGRLGAAELDERRRLADRLLERRGRQLRRARRRPRREPAVAASTPCPSVPPSGLGRAGAGPGPAGPPARGPPRRPLRPAAPVRRGRAAARGRARLRRLPVAVRRRSTTAGPPARRATPPTWCGDGRRAACVVLRDHTERPPGAGYALVNRTVLSRLFPDAYRELRVERLLAASSPRCAPRSPRWPRPTGRARAPSSSRPARAPELLRALLPRQPPRLPPGRGRRPGRARRSGLAAVARRAGAGRRAAPPGRRRRRRPARARATARPAACPGCCRRPARAGVGAGQRASARASAATSRCTVPGRAARPCWASRSASRRWRRCGAATPTQRAEVLADLDDAWCCTSPARTARPSVFADHLGDAERPTLLARIGRRRAARRPGEGRLRHRRRCCDGGAVVPGTVVLRVHAVAGARRPARCCPGGLGRVVDADVPVSRSAAA